MPVNVCFRAAAAAVVNFPQSQSVQNHTRHVAPGVYFVRQKERGPTAKVVVQR
jgi:hypothetical protein